MNFDDIGKRRLAEQYDKLIIQTLERYGYDLKTTLYLLSIGEMKIEKDESGATIFYGPGEPCRKQFYIHHMIPLFSITEETYEVFNPGDRIGITCKVITRLRVKDLTNNNYDMLGASVMF